MRKTILLFLFCFVPFLHASNTAEELKIEVCRDLLSLHGWCTPEKALNFIDLVLEVRPKVCVEIGVFGGRSIFPVASALKFLGQGIVIGIDPWDKIECIKYFDPLEDQADLAWWGKIDLNSIYRSYLSMVQKNNFEKYCITLKTTSEKAASQIDMIDILYIDGNHSETVSLQDVMLYLPKVRSGGYIWLNDTTWTSIQPSVALLSEQCDVVRLIDNGTCILFKKR
jgi:hypothetical protein